MFRQTTTTVFLGAMNEYFSYGVCHGCGFLLVTLLGERSGRADMVRRVAWLARLSTMRRLLRGLGA